MASHWTAADIPDLSGKTFIVTGGNSGLGYQTALALSSKGARVVLACRTQEKGEEALANIRGLVPNAEVELALLDLASLASIHDFAHAFRAKHRRLDALVNNAGVMAIPRRTTADGFEMQLGTNHLGHFALTGLLLPALAESAPSRVVTVSSMVHTIGKMDFDDLMGERRYRKWAAYGQSKLANLLFAYELARRLARWMPGVMSAACHPGYANTNLQSVGPEMTGSGIGKAVMAVGNRVFAQSAESGALPTLFAATASEVAGGDFIGPGGPFHVAGSPTKQKSSRSSHDAEVARLLWEASISLTGVDYSGL